MGERYCIEPAKEKLFNMSREVVASLASTPSEDSGFPSSTPDDEVTGDDRSFIDSDARAESVFSESTSSEVTITSGREDVGVGVEDARDVEGSYN